MSMSLVIVLNVFGVLIGTIHSEHEHRVHNIVLFREKYSWCKLTPIQQIIASPGYDSVTIDNNICVGACYSYSIPKTQPAEPGEIIGPYCDSCQPNVTKCYHVTLTADNNNLLGPKTIRKQIEIIESCECKTCNKNPTADCEINDNSLELPSHLFTNKDVKTTTLNPTSSELFSDADLMKFKPDIKTNTISKIFENDSTNGNNANEIIEKKYDINPEMLKLLKTIQNEPSNTVLKYDKDEIRKLLDMVEGPEKKLNDKNLLEFVNYVNSNNADDFELDIQKLKDVLISYQKNRELIEKHRSFWLEFSDNGKIEEDFKKLNLAENYGIEGNTLGMKHHYTGSHIGMGVQKSYDIDAPTLVTLRVPSSSSNGISSLTTGSTTTATISSTVINTTSTENPTSTDEQSTKKHHHNHHHNHHHHHDHYVMEEESVNGKMEHLIKGPHGSLVLTPDIKVEKKLNIESDALKPNHQGVVISYTGNEQNNNTPK